MKQSLRRLAGIALLLAALLGMSPSAVVARDGLQSSAATPLPSAPVHPDVGPVLEGRESLESVRAPVPPAERPRIVLKSILGLLVLLLLSYLAGHPRVQAWERTLGITQAIVAGFPFVLLGLFARLPQVGILTGPVLADMAPILRIGLGWIGFVCGFRFDLRLFEGLAPSVMRAAVWTTTLPFLTVLLICGFELVLLSGESLPGALHNPVFLREALVLGIAGAAAAAALNGMARPARAKRTLTRIIQLEELAVVLGLAILSAFFRTEQREATWQLPGAAWMLLTLGLGVVIGFLVSIILRESREGPEFVLLTLGSISFAAGIAGFLRLSPVVVLFLAGILVRNFPGAYKERLGPALHRLERPVYLLFLITVGALWQIDDVRGWLMMPVFVAARLLGRIAGSRLAHRQHGFELEGDDRRALAIAPIGSLAIATVVNSQLLYPAGEISIIVSAVIGGGILTEVFVQLARPRANGGESPA